MQERIAYVLLATVALAVPLRGQQATETNIETDLRVSYLELDPETSQYLLTTVGAMELRVTRYSHPTLGFGVHGFLAIPPSAGPAPGMRGFGGHLSWRPGQDTYRDRIGFELSAAGTLLNVYDVDKLLSLRCDTEGRCDRSSSAYPTGWVPVLEVEAMIGLRVIGRASLVFGGALRMPFSPWDGGGRPGASVIPGLTGGLRLR